MVVDLKAKKEIRGILFKFLAVVILAILAASTLLPYIIMVSSSLMAQFEIYNFPPRFSRPVHDFKTMLRCGNLSRGVDTSLTLFSLLPAF